MAHIRWEIHNFVDAWNNHTIRAQPNRPHVHSGKPVDMYTSPPKNLARQCGTPLPLERWNILNHLAILDGVELDDFLPHDVFALCKQIMSRYQETSLPSPDAPFLERYLFLQDQLKRHEAAEAEPALSLLERPAGGWKAFDEKMNAEGINIGDELREVGREESEERSQDSSMEGKDFESGDDLEFPI